jgi:hypothetical protein
MSRQRGPRGRAPLGPFRLRPLILLLCFGLAARNRLLDVLQGQLQLLGIELLRAPAKSENGCSDRTRLLRPPSVERAISGSGPTPAALQRRGACYGRVLLYE